MILYHQTSEFTCGPSSLMMAKNMLDSSYIPNKKDEYLLWRRANTVFMGSDHPGCSPYGLALAAEDIGLSVRIWVHNAATLFHSWTRKAEHLEIMKMTIAADEADCRKRGLITDFRTPIPIADIRIALDGKHIPVTLTHENVESHWVCLMKITDTDVRAYNPYPDDNVDHNEDMVDVYTYERFRKLLGKEQAIVLISLA